MALLPSPALLCAKAQSTLAQSGGAGSSANTTVQSIALWAAALIGALVLGAVALYAIRRRLLGADGPVGGDALSLHDLREMRARGDLNDEEFEAARNALLGRSESGEGRRATPGFDLTGEPLPNPDQPPRKRAAGDSPGH